MGGQLRRTGNPLKTAATRSVTWAKAELCNEGNVMKQSWHLAPSPSLISMHNIFSSRRETYTQTLHPDDNKKLCLALVPQIYEALSLSTLATPPLGKTTVFLLFTMFDSWRYVTIFMHMIIMQECWFFPHHEQTDAHLLTLMVLWFCSLNTFVFHSWRASPTEGWLPSLPLLQVNFFSSGNFCLCLPLTVMKPMVASLLFTFSCSEVAEHNATHGWNFY